MLQNTKLVKQFYRLTANFYVLTSGQQFRFLRFIFVPPYFDCTGNDADVDDHLRGKSIGLLCLQSLS